MPRPAKEEVPPSPLGACWLQRACCLRLEWQWEPGQQGAHTAQPFKYMLTYSYNSVFDDTGWSKALDVIGGIWDLPNHAIMLQLQEFPGADCLDT